MRRLVLASASPARRFLLESAGLKPEVVVSGVDESDAGHLPAARAVEMLAIRKAEAVLPLLGTPAPLVVGCDSLLEFDGRSWGKPASAAEAAERWRRMTGRTGLLHTGHALIDAADGRRAVSVDTATIRFGRPDEAEIRAYAATPEALQVAGPFTLEGRSSPWIDSIDGNYGTVTGISLPVLRRLLAELGVPIVELWA